MPKATIYTAILLSQDGVAVYFTPEARDPFLIPIPTRPGANFIMRPIELNKIIQLPSMFQVATYRLIDKPNGIFLYYERVK